MGLSAEGGIKVESFARAELDEHPPGPICWMWDRLAKAAMDGVSGGYRPDLLLLLGAMNLMMGPKFGVHIYASRDASLCFFQMGGWSH